ncbi:MAG TPA: aminotransferase class I/II-fold pyridoxal phosphate-dependent enzyme [Methylomirabilota bacterium]|nr:aminotransferase class I/II-fold pyridoxal phosphate-dependent enzyme [Methylomirabilota bacterium]
MLDNLRAIAAARRALLDDEGVSPFGTVVEKMISATEGILDGRRTILAGTNNYLGLTFDPDCIAAACAALRDEGTGTTGSRMANGTFAAHAALERELAEFFGRRGAVVFSTGYLANLGMLSALTGRDDVMLIDADCHASIYDGCRLGTAEVLRFRHNDVEDLDTRLRRLGERSSRALIVVEGIYSMLGDRAPLAAIAGLKRRHGAYLLVDEAHSFGVLGAHGRGLAEEAGVEDAVDFVLGTFSKSLGTIGGFGASDHPELESLRYASRPYLFTASPSPSVVASARTALAVLQARPELRGRLWDNAHRLYGRLRELGFTLGPQPSPIVAVMMAGPGEGLAFWRALLEQGVYVNLIVPPAAPNGGCLLRCSVGAAHTPEQIERIADAFAALVPASTSRHH